MAQNYKKMRIIPPSELIINPDGSVFHLHLLPEEVADTIILVGDPARVDTVAAHFSEIEVRKSSREFSTATGYYNGKRLSVISTGIGCDNCDIVMTELDALHNIDFQTRTEKTDKNQLTIVRLGTSGAVQDDISIGDYVMSCYSIGIDGLLNFYGGSVCESEIEQAFIEQTAWGERLARPYVVANDQSLIKLFEGFARAGVTISAGGFYAPQGRVVRLPLSQSNYLEKIEKFSYKGLRITNFEMEGSAIAGLAKLMGHRALTVCAIIAQRTKGDSNPDYSDIVNKLIAFALKTLTK